MAVESARRRSTISLACHHMEPMSGLNPGMGCQFLLHLVTLGRKERNRDHIEICAQWRNDEYGLKDKPYG